MAIKFKVIEGRGVSRWYGGDEEFVAGQEHEADGDLAELVTAAAAAGVLEILDGKPVKGAVESDEDSLKNRGKLLKEAVKNGEVLAARMALHEEVIDQEEYDALVVPAAEDGDPRAMFLLGGSNLLLEEIENGNLEVEDVALTMNTTVDSVKELLDARSR